MECMECKEVFLTPFLKSDGTSLYYRESSAQGNFRVVKKRNWHIALEEYGWEKLPKKWITKLNKLSPKIEKNSLYGVMDVESDGDCFFHCIAKALNEKYDTAENVDDVDGVKETLTSDDIRGFISYAITEDQFETMINYYRIMKDANDFDENWDPHEVETIDDFRDILETAGNLYWGDYMLLQVLINALRLNIFIMTHNSEPEECSIYNTLNDYNEDYDSVFLLFVDECHFKLIGHFNDSKMISYFKDKIIPSELLKLFSIIR
tara:strand:+ start:138 stop:926 length:789 start_codon:yes stop_codon:yes gene_type:complete